MQHKLSFLYGKHQVRPPATASTTSSEFRVRTVQSLNPISKKALIFRYSFQNLETFIN